MFKRKQTIQQEANFILILDRVKNLQENMESTLLTIEKNVLAIQDMVKNNSNQVLEKIKYKCVSVDQRALKVRQFLMDNKDCRKDLKIYTQADLKKYLVSALKLNLNKISYIMRSRQYLFQKEYEEFFK